MTVDPMSPGCRAFRLEMPAMLTASPPPEHVTGCVDCRRHWLAARVLASCLREKPPIPDALRRSETQERLCERVVAAAESAPLGALLDRALVPEAVPSDLALPAQDLARRVVGGASFAPAQLWQRVQADSIAYARQRRRGVRMRRAGILTGAAAAIVTGLLLLQPAGNPAEISIVFEDMAVPPTIDIMPVSVLRSSLR